LFLANLPVQVQYRFPQELAQFPSNEFYEGRLRSGIKDSYSTLSVLSTSSFPWPVDTRGTVIPTIFVPCETDEDIGGRSKSNDGQVILIRYIVKLLSTKAARSEAEPKLTIKVLSPYRKQIQELHSRLPSEVESFTVDSFQGRESDIIIFSSVRSNAEGEIGFLDVSVYLDIVSCHSCFCFSRTLED
jgi:superfamily I DNA and/or RNA helicase